MTERLTTIAGSMFSGKTEELIRLITRAEIAERRVQVFKPIIDDRWGKVTKISSHSGAEHDALPLANSIEIIRHINKNTQIVAIDEIQFFDDRIMDVIRFLLENDIEVVVAGLPLDFRGRNFGMMPEILSYSDEIIKTKAICTHRDNGEICGDDATRTQRLIEGKPANYSDPIVLIGGQESYVARCPNHHIVPGKPMDTF